MSDLHITDVTLSASLHTGIPGPRGADGLTTSVTVNGETFEQQDGNIDLGTLLREHQSLDAYRTAADQDAIDSGKESAANKVTTISAAGTDTQYPSAKAVYDVIGDIEAAINAIRGVSL